MARRVLPLRICCVHRSTSSGTEYLCIIGVWALYRLRSLTRRRGRIRRAASERQRAHQLTLDRPTWTNLSRLARLHRTSRSAIVRTLIAEAMKIQKLAEERGTESRRPDAHP